MNTLILRFKSVLELLNPLFPGGSPRLAVGGSMAFHAVRQELASQMKSRASAPASTACAKARSRVRSLIRARLKPSLSPTLRRGLPPKRPYRLWNRLGCLSSILVCTLASAQNAQFTNITQSAGIRFVHNNGATGKRFLPETLGVGVAFIDYDNDGWQDILFANSEDWPGAPKRPSTLKLYRNNGNGTFTDVTQK